VVDDYLRESTGRMFHVVSFTYVSDISGVEHSPRESTEAEENVGVRYPLGLVLAAEAASVLNEHAASVGELRSCCFRQPSGF
jgi:hypothetical protein